MKWISAMLCLAFTIRTPGQTLPVHKQPVPVAVTWDFDAQKKHLACIWSMFQGTGRTQNTYIL